MRETETSPAEPVELVAELSANHNQNWDLAAATVREMARSGADTVKLQSYDARSLTLPLDTPPFLIEDPCPWRGKSLHQLYEEAAMPWEWHEPLIELARENGLQALSTVFCERGLDLLEKLGLERYKIASFEIGHLELIRRIAARGKPMIFSLGIADFAAIERALESCRAEGNQQITLLQCTSAYPADPADANLRMIPHLKSTFGFPVGLSDHTTGHTVAVAAAALGARMIEKHFILDRKLGGPDSSFSAEPAEFRALTEAVRICEKALGKIDYGLNERKQKSRGFARSIFLVRDRKQGHRITPADVAVLRPGAGLEPHHLPRVLGAKLRFDLRRGTPLCWDLLDRL